MGSNVDWSQFAAGAQEAPVVSQKEALLRQQSGGYGPDGKPVPSAMVVDTQTPAPRGIDWSKYAATPPQPKPQVPTPAQPTQDAPIDDPEGDAARALAEGSPSVVRGAIKGLAAPVTIPADVAIWGTNKLKKAFDPNASTLDTDSSDVLGSVLDKMGLKKAAPVAINEQGGGGSTSALGTVGELTGAALSTPFNPKFSADINPGRWWSSANPTSGVNNAIIQNAVRTTLGVPATQAGEYGVTSGVMKQAQDAYKAALDTGRNANTVFQDNPRTIATTLANMAQDQGYEKDTLKELLARPEVTKLFRILQDGKATTEQLGNASSALGSAAAGTSDSILRNTLFKFRDYAEDAIKSSLSPADAATYEQGLTKFKAYQQIANSGALNTTTGEVNPVKLLNSIKNDADWINGTNQSPLYQVLRHVERGQKAVESMTDSIPGKLGYAVRTAAKSIPGVAQSIIQRGVPETLRQIANHPGFLQSLGGNSDADNVSDGAQPSP
jgi:hypothetical protein